MSMPDAWEAIEAALSPLRRDLALRAALLDEQARCQQLQTQLETQIATIQKHIRTERKALGWLDRTGISGIWEKWANQEPQPRMVALRELERTHEVQQTALSQNQHTLQRLQFEIEQFGDLDSLRDNILEEKLELLIALDHPARARWEKFNRNLAKTHSWLREGEACDSLIKEIIRHVEHLKGALSREELEPMDFSRMRIGLQRPIKNIHAALRTLDSRLKAIPHHNGLRKTLSEQFSKRFFRIFEAWDPQLTLWVRLSQELEYVGLSVRKARRELATAMRRLHIQSETLKRQQRDWLLNLP